MPLSPIQDIHPSLVNGRNPGALYQRNLGSFTSPHSCIFDEGEYISPMPIQAEKEQSPVNVETAALSEEEEGKEYDSPPSPTVGYASPSEATSISSRMHRPLYLTQEIVKEGGSLKSKRVVRQWPGAELAGRDAHLAEVPEYVGEMVTVQYPSPDRHRISECYRWSWVVFLDRRFYPRSQWPHTERDVQGCNRFQSSAKVLKIALLDRHWDRVIWAKKLPKKKESSERFRVQVARPWTRNRSTLTVGAKLGFKPNGQRNHNSLPCNVCDDCTHSAEFSPCLMIIADSMPLPASMTALLPSAITVRDYHEMSPETPRTPVIKTGRKKRNLCESKSSDETAENERDLFAEMAAYFRTKKGRKAQEFARRADICQSRWQSPMSPWRECGTMSPMLSSSEDTSCDCSNVAICGSASTLSATNSEDGEDLACYAPSEESDEYEDGGLLGMDNDDANEASEDDDHNDGQLEGHHYDQGYLFDFSNF